MPAIAIPALIGLGGAAINAITGHKAATSAENTLNTAANAASAASLEAGRTATEGVNNAVGAATAETQAARDRAIRAAQEGTAAGNSRIDEGLQRQRANLNPYLEGGQRGLQGLTDLADNPENFKFNVQDFNDDPSTAIALKEGLAAIQKTAAARGLGPSSGGQLKAISKFAVEQTEKGYGDVYKRSENTFNTNKASRIQTLQSLTGVGERAATGLNAAEGTATAETSRNLVDLGTATGGYDTAAAARTSDYGIRGADATGRILTDSTRDSNDALLQGANARAAGTQGRARAISGLTTNATNIGVDATSRYYGQRAPQRQTARI